MRWIVICLNDAGEYVFASHGWWNKREDAYHYARTVSKKRKPLVVEASQELWGWNDD